MGGGASKETYEMKKCLSSQAPLQATQTGKLPRAASDVGSSPKSDVNKIAPLKNRQRSASYLVQDASAAAPKLTRSKSVVNPGGSFSTSGLNIQVSPKIPWLVKKTAVRSFVSAKTFTFGQVIGKGLMGTVRAAKFSGSSPGLWVAIKSIRKDYIKKHNDERHVNNEKEILCAMTSPFCIRLFGTFQDDNHIHFVLEFAAGGELFRRLSKKQYFPPNTAKFYLCEVFLAVWHVQSLGFVYRDLKPENVMLDEYGHCKLVDFGFSTRPNEHGMCLTNVGTPAYLSPEQLNGKFTQGYTSIVDWWSLGVLLYELMTGVTPFCKNFSESPYEIYLRVLKGKIKFPRSFNSSAKDLVSSLLHADLSTRLVDPKQIKSHPYFNDVDWEAVANRQILPPFVPRLAEEGDMMHFDDYGTFEMHDCPSKPKKGKGPLVLGHFAGF